MLQWVPDERDVHYEMIVRSFLEVFPNATAWANGSMLVGTREPLRIDRAAVRRAARRSGDAGRDGVRRHRRRDVAGRALHRGSRRAPGVRGARPGARRRPSARSSTSARSARGPRSAPISRSSTATQRTCSTDWRQARRAATAARSSLRTTVRTAVANGLQRNQPPNALVELRRTEELDLVVGDGLGRVVIPEKTRIIETGSVDDDEIDVETRDPSRTPTARPGRAPATASWRRRRCSRTRRRHAGSGNWSVSTRRWSHHVSVMGSTSAGSGSANSHRTAHSPIAMMTGSRSRPASVRWYSWPRPDASGTRRSTPSQLEVAQPLGEQRARDAGHAALDVVEAGAAEHQLAQDQRRPPVGEHFAAQRDRAVLPVITHGVREYRKCTIRTNRACVPSPA